MNCSFHLYLSYLSRLLIHIELDFLPFQVTSQQQGKDQHKDQGAVIDRRKLPWSSITRILKDEGQIWVIQILSTTVRWKLSKLSNFTFHVTIAINTRDPHRVSADSGTTFKRRNILCEFHRLICRTRKISDIVDRNKPSYKGDKCDSSESRKVQADSESKVPANYPKTGGAINMLAL
jgi:hypothetical protein